MFARVVIPCDQSGCDATGRRPLGRTMSCSGPPHQIGQCPLFGVGEAGLIRRKPTPGRRLCSSPACLQPSSCRCVRVRSARPVDATEPVSVNGGIERTKKPPTHNADGWKFFNNLFQTGHRPRSTCEKGGSEVLSAATASLFLRQGESPKSKTAYSRSSVR